jgi:hypothetical protein
VKSVWRVQEAERGSYVDCAACACTCRSSLGPELANGIFVQRRSVKRQRRLDGTRTLTRVRALGGIRLHARAAALESALASEQASVRPHIHMCTQHRYAFAPLEASCTIRRSNECFIRVPAGLQKKTALVLREMMERIQ